MANLQEKENQETILQTIINLSEKLQDCKLEDSAIAEEKAQINRLASYLNVDEISAILFMIIFYIQSEKSSSVSIGDVADFLDYPHICILQYTKNFSMLQKKCLIEQRRADSRASRRSGGESGYEIPDIVIECIVEGIPLSQVEEKQESTEDIFRKFFSVFKTCKENGMDENFHRSIARLERKYEQNEVIKNINKEFPANAENRVILYLLCSLLVTGLDLDNNDDESEYEDFIYETLSAFIGYGRCKEIAEENDILIEKGFVKKCIEYRDTFRRRCTVVTDLRLTSKAVKTFFGSESERYVTEDYEKTELEKTTEALYEFTSFYEKNMPPYQKKERLIKIERKYSALSFFKKIQKDSKLKNADRFFLYDCAKDFLNGDESSLCSTVRDLYGKSEAYFKVLRSMLDEKNELVKGGYIEIEKNESIERTSVTLGEKTIEILYGNNADLYIKKGVSGKNIIEPAKLPAKTLFYSEQVQKQIDMLEESLSQKNLVAMQKRLESKGLPKGVAVLLYGAPGTGKTETVYQLAKKTNRKILHVDIAESKSMWFGESEKIIKKIFTNYRQLCKTAERHKENTPILLFNEADALISKRKDVASGNCAQTENAIQNILLEEMEKLDGIIFATTNLCNNMDKAFERRFLFKVEYEKPNLEARTKIWQNKLPALSEEDLEKLAERFDFSGGEIDNIVRKCEITEVIKGVMPVYSEIEELCENERLEKDAEHHMGFCFD